MVLPLLRGVVPPLLRDMDSPTVVFPDTSVTVLRAIVTLFYEGTIITTQHITSDVLTTLKNLGIDPDRLTKVGFNFNLLILKSISLLLVQTFLTIFEPRIVLEGLSSAQHETKKKKRKASKEAEGEKENGKKRRRKGRERSHSCQLCEFWCETVKAMSEHTESQHPGETLHCPYPGCQRQLESYMKLRTHQHYAKHFITDYNKEKDSQDVEKSFKLNNNENAEAGTETNATEGEKSLEPLQEEDQTGTTEVNLSTGQPSDELDVKPEFADEAKE